MSHYEVPEPILNSPFAEPTSHFRFDDANNIGPPHVWWTRS